MKKIFSLLLLSIGTAWIYINIFWSTFYVFAQGITKPWLLLNGFVLFRDMVWNRAGFELYLLAGFYKIFGISPLNFQLFIFLCQASIGIIMFLLLSKKSFWLATSSYIIYATFAFLVYGAINESAEILIGLFAFLVFYLYWEFIEKKNPILLFLAGIATGFSLITKQSSVLIPFSVLFLLSRYAKKEILKESIYYLSGVAIPVLSYAGYFAWNNALYDLYQNTIYNVLFPYRENAPLWGLSEGMRMLAFHLTALATFILVKTNTIISKPIKSALVIFVSSLFLTLLPTFWSYRLISALPLFSVMTSVVIFASYDALRKYRRNAIKQVGTILIVNVLLVLFLVQTIFYFNQNVRYIIDNDGYVLRPPILDGYSDDEQKVAQWLTENTKEHEKIFNMATEYVLYFSNRFPANKYDDSMYFGFFPLHQYYKTITENSAKIVVYDTNLPNDWPMLKDWKYLRFLKERYAFTKSIGPYEIYLLNP